MQDNPQLEYTLTELNPDQLSREYGVNTKWHVISGTVCSGKSTLIDQLANKGFQTVPEPGRQYFEREMAKGRTIDEVRADSVALVHILTAMTLEIERGLNTDEVQFLDRAVPDTLAFSRTAGMDPNGFLPDCFHHRYASVFLLDRFPVEQDGIRVENDSSADFIDRCLAYDYTALGYNVTRVPVMSREERLEFVLFRLSSQGLI